MSRYCALLILFVHFLLPCIAQQQASVWYFGEKGGLHFTSSGPTVLNDGQMSSFEGVASIADNNGVLQFYTEGTRIWNRQHNLMPNGQGLLGNISSTQSAIIVPKLNDPKRYYVFTVAGFAQPDGLNYSMVNMNLAGGLGDVEIKNRPLQSPVCEKITAVKHCNSRDVWVIVHAYNSDQYYSYLVTDTGIRAPVISSAGLFVSDIQNFYVIGCLKASPNGKKLAAAHFAQGVDLLDFDNTTGVVSNGQPLYLPSEPYGSFPGPYGVEFSPNSTLLYIAQEYFDNVDIDNFSVVLQYDIAQPTLAAIQSSKKVIYRRPSNLATGSFGTLQLAPDGKIYMAETLRPSLSVINKPDEPGGNCQFGYGQQNVEHNNGGWSMYGLPAFIQSYFRPAYTFRGACNGNLINFDYKRAPHELALLWDFGDPASGAGNFSTADSTSHLYTHEGMYTVKLIRYTDCGNDTVVRIINAGIADVELGNDTSVCGLNQHTLSPTLLGGSSSYSYEWQNGATTPTFAAMQSGLYWVDVTNTVNGCKKRDSIHLLFRPRPQFSLGADVHKCEGEVAALSTSFAGQSYLWNTGETGDSINVTAPGMYWLQVTVDQCPGRDSINVIHHPYPSVFLGNDTVLCERQTLVLDAQNAGMQYKWQNNSNGRTYTVRSPGKYWVQVNDNNCRASDTIHIAYLQPPKFTLGNDRGICPGMTILLQPQIEQGAQLLYNWNNILHDSSLKVTQPGLYSLTLANNCGAYSDEINIYKGGCAIYVPGAFSPNGDGVNDVLKAFYGENVTAFDFRIHNRWGQTLFATSNINTGWNGTWKGQLQNNDVYVWYIRYKTVLSDKEQVMKGTVLLVR